MLYVHDGVAPRRNELGGARDGGVWIDLVDPSEAELAAAQTLTGLRVPSRAEVSEIESSSRVYSEDGTLYLSIPAAVQGEHGHPIATPVGFVLSERWLVTLRFGALPAFESYGDTFAKGGSKGSLDTFVGLLEVIVDRLADALELVAADLAAVSTATFRPNGEGKEKPRRGARKLDRLLTNIGAHGDALGCLRDTLVSLRRVVLFTRRATQGWESADAKGRLHTLHDDITSLNDYEQQLSGKVAFLLDAVLGYINIEQNNTVRLLTVVSVLGIPPTFVVGLYGMNFKSMPEVDWPHGYAFGWAMILLSIVIPAIWLRVRHWM